MIKKFKIWNKKEKKLHGPFSFSDIKAYDGECQVIFFVNSSNDYCDIGNNLGYSQDNTKEIQENLKFLQFTGLLDAAGKEIYEGDIINVEFPEHLAPNFADFDTVKSESHIGRLDQSRLGEYFCNSKDGSFSLQRYYVWTVLGNIHQNPELLS